MEFSTFAVIKYGFRYLDIVMDIRVFEAFSGYGSQHIALERLMLEHSASFSYSVVGISEIDSNALKAYYVLHGDCQIFWKVV